MELIWETSLKIISFNLIILDKFLTSFSWKEVSSLYNIFKWSRTKFSIKLKLRYLSCHGTNCKELSLNFNHKWRTVSSRLLFSKLRVQSHIDQIESQISGSRSYFRKITLQNMPDDNLQSDLREDASKINLWVISDILNRARISVDNQL